MTKMRVNYSGCLRTECIHLESGAKLITDAPKDNMGKGEAFSPTDLLAVSVASCMLTLMGIAARKASFDLSGAYADVEKEMISAPVRRLHKLSIRIHCPHCPDQDLRIKLENAALHCPVHESLHPDIQQDCRFYWGGGI